MPKLLGTTHSRWRCSQDLKRTQKTKRKSPKRNDPVSKQLGSPGSFQRLELQVLELPEGPEAKLPEALWLSLASGVQTQGPRNPRKPRRDLAGTSTRPRCMCWVLGLLCWASRPAHSESLAVLVCLLGKRPGGFTTCPLSTHCLRKSNRGSKGA